MSPVERSPKVVRCTVSGEQRQIRVFIIATHTLRELLRADDIAKLCAELEVVFALHPAEVVNALITYSEPHLAERSGQDRS